MSDDSQPAVNSLDLEIGGLIKDYMATGNRSGFQEKHWARLDELAPGISNAAMNLDEAFNSQVSKVPFKQRIEALMALDKRDDLRAMGSTERYMAIKKTIDEINENIAKKPVEGQQPYQWEPSTIMHYSEAYDLVKPKGGN